MSAAVNDIYFLNIEDAYAEAAKQQQIVDTDGKQRLQYCYYDGPLTDITLENFIQVEQDRFVEFFSHNHLPLPQLLGLSNAGQLVFNAMPDDVLQEIRQQRASYKIGDYIHFDTYFVDPLKALNVAKQKNRVDCRHPTIDGLQICYFRGELPEHGIANLIHLELEAFEDFFIRSRLRVPENLDLPEDLEAEIKAGVREDLNRLIGEVKRKRNWLGHRLFAKAKALAPLRLPGEKPRMFVPANRLTTVMQYSSRGIANAFSAMGWEVLFYIGASEMEGVNLIDMLEQYIDFAPHACFQVNTLNNAFIHPDVVNLLWWQDLMPPLRQRQPMNWRSNDFCFSISPVFDDYLRDCQAHSIQRLHFVIDEQVFNNRIPQQRENKVVFVGSSYLRVVNSNNASQRQALDQLTSLMAKGACFDSQTVAAIASSCELNYDFVFWKLLHYTIRDYSVKWLCEVPDFPVEIYGRYWREDDEVAPHFCGELPHGEAVANVYRQANYALVCHPFEINSQRLVEVAACGCIPLVYDCRDVAEGPFWEDYCLFFKTADQLKNILQQGLRPKFAPEGLAAHFTYRSAAQKVIESCRLDKMPVIPPGQGGGTISLMADQYGENLRLHSQDSDLLRRCQENLQTNLQSLHRHRPSLYQHLLGAWAESDCLIRLARVIDAEPWRVSIECNDEKYFSLDPLLSLQHRMTIADNAARLIRENTCCYGLIGLGAGDELMEVFAATANPIAEMAEFEVAIYLLEADPLFWLLNLLLHDWQALLAAKRLQIYHQADCWSQLDNQFQRFEAPLPDMLFSLNPRSDAVALRLFELIEQSKQSRAARHRENLQEIADYYAAINHEQWRQKFRPEHYGELRVMGFISRFSSFLKYCMRDWLDGFERLGVKTLSCIEEENYYLSTVEQLIDEINRFKPDLILTIDHFRHEYPGIPENVPFVNWIQDMLPNIVNNEVSPSRLDFTCVFVKDWLRLTELPVYQEESIEFMPLGYNDKIYYPINKGDQYSCDVLVVTHLCDPVLTLEPIRNPAQYAFIPNNEELKLITSNQLTERDLIETYTAIDKFCMSLNLHEIHDLFSIKPGQNEVEFNSILKDLGISVDNITMEIMIRNRLHFEFLTKMKTLPVSILIAAFQNLNIQVFGRNWEKYGKFLPYSKGVAENGFHLNNLMNEAKICLNVSPGVTLHMRAIETMASGAFMISREMQQDGSRLTDHFSRDEIVLYQDENDLVDKISYFLVETNHRKTIARRAHKKLTQTFSYKAICVSLLEKVNNRLNSVLP